MDMAHERDASSEEEVMAGGELRRGPWTVEKDLLLVNNVAAQGEGSWNSLVRSAGIVGL
jgi:myb proto-oncogene protein